MGFFDRLFGQQSKPQSGDFQALLDQSMNELRDKTSALAAVTHFNTADWSVDQDAGSIVFTRADGIIITAPVQIVGTYNTADGTWLWGWDHPSVQPPLQDHARAVHAYGQKHGIDELTTRKLSCSEDHAWEFTALACKLCAAQGAYRGPTRPALVFMTFGNPTMHRDENVAPPAAGADITAGMRQVDAPEVIEFLKAYMAENFEADRVHHEHESEEGALRKAIAAKHETYERCWRRDDDYWEPGSVGWPSDDDWSRTRNWKIYEVTPDIWRVAYELHLAGETYSSYAYDVRRFADGLRIVDFHM
jgi:hypothetical protein